MPFTLRSSMQSEASKPTVVKINNTFTRFVNETAGTSFGVGPSNAYSGAVCACSDDGVYITYVHTNNILVSQNSGTSFTATSITGGQGSGCCMSYDGTYQYYVNSATTNQHVSYSSNHGTSFSNTALSNTSTALGGIACNVYGGASNVNAGRYVCVSGGSKSCFYFSDDYGANFTQYTNALITGKTVLDMDISDDGTNVYLFYTSGSSVILIQISNMVVSNVMNPTPTWAQYGNTATSVSGSFTNLMVSSDGTFIVIGNYASTPSTGLLISRNSGSSWSIKTIYSYNLKIMPTMSRNGQYIIAGTQTDGTHSGVFYSTDKGNNFTAINDTNNWIGTPVSNASMLVQNWKGSYVSPNGRCAGFGGDSGCRMACSIANN